MYHKRKDNGCETKILASKEDTVLVEARWPVGKPPEKQQRNIVNLTPEYFEEKYGFRP